ncbi:hypothetical protein THOM_0186 [Trachipleistophora hominis]|uniref:Uncharacterized protein n=1 Tax=Trachipleistophora hominis TaxID=72359 RepID=L7K0J3_TRAHO|nr:hypothetical protein THOM_0186 [Trachipleistophora hominis]
MILKEIEELQKILSKHIFERTGAFDVDNLHARLEKSQLREFVTQNACFDNDPNIVVKLDDTFKKLPAFEISQENIEVQKSLAELRRKSKFVPYGPTASNK